MREIVPKIFLIYDVPPVPISSTICMRQDVDIVHTVIKLISISLAHSCVLDLPMFSHINAYSDGIGVGVECVLPLQGMHAG